MLRTKKTSVFRFQHELPPGLPLAVRSCGTYSLAADARPEPPMKKWFTEVFWSEEGSGEFVLGRQKVAISGTGIFFLLPGELHDIRPTGPFWKYHWLTLDHPKAPQWLAAFGLVKRPLPAQSCPSGLFIELQRALGKATMEGDRQASHIAHAILLACLEGSLAPLSRAPSSWVEDCRKRLDERFSDPGLNIASIAGEIGVHRSTLFRSFLSAYGMTPSHYLQNLRLHHAIHLLKQTDTPVKEVAIESGLANSNYLGRLMVRRAGLPPGKFRSAYRQQRLSQS